MVDKTVLDKAITGAESIIDVPFNTYANSIGFQFVYEGLDADITLMPQVSLNNGLNYDDFEAAKITLDSSGTSESITITDLKANTTIRWKALASDATTGTITSVYVSK